MTFEFKGLFLWHVILDHQSWPERQIIIISAEESQVVIPEIVVVTDLESQAKLGDTIQIDVLKCRAIEPGPVPAVERIVFDHGNRIPVSRALEVGHLQTSVRERADKTEGAGADVHQDVSMGGEGVAACHRFGLDHDQRTGDHGIIGDVEGREVQNRAELAVLGVVAEHKGGIL